jgi:predicted house-cleaning noncanonical NTP pyrophosphatase (MazG superfamily)
MNKDIQEIFENAKNDPSLFSSIDIDELLDKIENETTEYLENKTLSDISQIVFETLTDYGNQNKNLNRDTIQIYCEKLAGYRYVERICELRQGIYIRWIKNGNTKLFNGGIVVNIKVGDEIQIVCKTQIGKFLSIKFNHCIVFQKLTMEEQLILMSYHYIQKENEKD